MRFRLRTLLIVLALLPPVLAVVGVWGWRQYVAWRSVAIPATSGPVFLGAVVTNVLGESGAHVTQVRPGSPAEAGGLLADDIIVDIQNKPCTDSSTVVNIVLSSSDGQRLPMTVRRDGQQKSLMITLRRRVSP